MKDEIELRSEEVQELLGTTPHWMVRWGMLFALVLLIATIWGLYLFSYPETVTTSVQITREDPGADRNALRAGSISSVLVNTEDTVKAGQTLIAFDSNADLADVHVLDDHLKRMGEGNDSLLYSMPMPADLLLGAEDLNDKFYAFLEQQKEVQNLSAGRLNQMSIDEIEREIRLETRGISADRRRIQSLESERILYEETYIFQENLIKGGRGDLNQFRDAKAKLLQIDRYLQETRTSINNKQATIRLLRSRLENTAAISESAKAAARRKLRDAFNSLRAELEAWRQVNIISSPIDGIVILGDAAQAGEFVKVGQRLALVLPIASSNLIGKTTLDLDESGQVEEGQKVLVDFYSFPAQQYGSVEGIVDRKSKIPDSDNQLSLEIRFPNGLVTNTGHTLEVGQYMAGQMKIVIQEKRLIEWLLERL